LLCFMIGDRLQHVQDIIRPALASGRVVLCDRYHFTMIATMFARGFADEESWVAAACRQVPRPDAAFLFDASLEVTIDRIRTRGSTREGYVERAHLERTQTAFKALAAEGHLDLIDTSSADPTPAFAEAWRQVERLLPRPASLPGTPSTTAAPSPGHPA
jgi:thymidylate kinase